jgi:phosphate transport system protein
MRSSVDEGVAELFVRVSEALAGATSTLLSQDAESAQRVVDQDKVIDQLAMYIENSVWKRLEAGGLTRRDLRRLVGVLQLLPELERSADLAEHIAQRAVAGLGAEMTPVSRGLVQRMAEVGLEMWRGAAEAYAERSAQGVALDEADEELDILHRRLVREVEDGAMSSSVTAQVTLLARFYERLGDHAVNIARRIERSFGQSAAGGNQS